MRSDIFIGNGIRQTCAVDTDGGFEQYTNLIIILSLIQCYIATATGHNHRCIVGRVGDGYFRIDERIGFTIRELIAPFVSIVVPRNTDLILVDRRLERFYGSRLRHTSHRTNVGIGGLVVDDEQITVAMGIGLVVCLTGTVTIAWVTIETTATHIDRTQSVKGTLGIGVVVFLKEILAFVEGRHHACGFNRLRGLFESCGRVLGSGTEQTSGIVIFWIIGSRRFADIPCGGISGIITVGTSDGDEGT